MISYRKITLEDIPNMAKMYMDTFNAEPWNDEWTMETATKRLHQMINVEDFYGILAEENDVLCAMVIGNKEQYYDCMMLNIKEFCVNNNIRGKGLGTKIYNELEMRAKEDGIDKVILLTVRGDLTEHFYHKQGFSSMDDMVFMTKQLK